MYNFGNMNRDQHQGRDDEDSNRDPDQKTRGLGGFISLLLIIAMVAGGYFYCSGRNKTNPDATADAVKDSAVRSPNQNASLKNGSEHKRRNKPR